MVFARALAALLLQLSLTAAADQESEPKHLLFQRAIQQSARGGGQACVELDAAVLAHAADRAGNDLRVFSGAGKKQRETPFALTESAPQPSELETVAAEKEQVHGNVASFELAMPGRPYSVVDLQTGLKDFMAKAEVTGLPANGGAARSLGAVTIFDLSSEGLPRSTELRLAEASLPRLRVRLEFSDAQGRPLSLPGGQVVTGALVPPSREAQTLYTPIAETRSLLTNGDWTFAMLQVQEHVPLDRLLIELAPSFHGDFVREVSVAARPFDDKALSANVPRTAEVVPGNIALLTRPSPGPGIPAIHFAQLSVPLALGTTLRSPATVTLQVHNVRAGKILAPLPIRSVLLEMRRRTLCFDAMAGELYTLRYGDPALRAPAYEYSRTFQPRADAEVARLGPEERNPDFATRDKRTTYATKYPELMWVLLIAVVALTCVLIRQRMEKPVKNHR